MQKYTKEQKDQYFRELRARWKNSKELAEKDEVAKALYQEVGGKVSYISFFLTLKSMQELGLKGIPYIDCKTYKGWQEAGFQVRKGETSKIEGITWIGGEKEDDEGEDKDIYIYPKVYSLFHRSQVEERRVSR